MTSRPLHSAFAAATAAAVLLLTPLVSAAQNTPSRPVPRITAAIDDSARATLPGSRTPRVHSATDLGALDSSTRLSGITLAFSRTAQQQADLDALIAAQQNPASPLFHQWLTPAEFGARFGIADSDLAKVENWLQSQGFSVDSVAAARDRITFSGSASTVASAFGAPLHRYRTGAETHFAPSADLTVPAALAGVVAGVRNLSDFRPRPQVRHADDAKFKPAFTSSFTSAQTGNHFLTPKDVAVIYDVNPLYKSGYDGTGQSIAVVGQSNIVPSDITNFQTAIGNTAKAPTLMLVPSTGTSTVYTGDESESDLDLEYASGMAPGATVSFVYVGNSNNSSVFDALNFAIDNRVANIIDISYGECELGLGSSDYASLNSSLAQAAAQGQTIVSAAGDAGSTDCNGEQGVSTSTQDAVTVDFPASSQYVTGMGGTEFPATDVASGNNTYFAAANGSDVLVSALSYIPEQVWNDDDATYGLSSGGGGVSIYTSAPSWQTGVPGILSGSFRFVPDISLDSSPENAPYAYCSSDQTSWGTGQAASCNSGLRDSSSQDLTVAGGTSFAAPIFAGMLAVLNQAKGYTAQGVVNPTLYSLASNPSTYASAFHDITAGSNECTAGVNYCTTAGDGVYAAATGYDEASGLGSVDLANLVAAWPENTSSGGTTTTPGFTLSATSLSLTSGTPGSSTVTVTPVNGYTGTVNWTVTPSATVSGACYSLASAVVSGSSAATATLNITTGNTGTTGVTTCPAGSSPLVAGGASGARASLQRPAKHPGHTAPIALAGLGVLALALFGLRSRRPMPVLLALALLGFTGLGLAGCSSNTVAATTGGGGTNSGPTTTNYTVTVIGVDSAHSSETAQTTLTLSVTTSGT